MNSIPEGAIARVVPIGDIAPYRKVFYAKTVIDNGISGTVGIDMKGDEYHIYQCYWRVEMLPTTAPEWNGEGLPPVGAVCEWSDCTGQWCKSKIMYLSSDIVVVASVEPGTENVEIAKSFITDGKQQFRPIRNKRDEAVAAMRNMGYTIGIGEHYEHCIYDAIAAGKIPGVILVDSVSQ